LRTIEQSLSAHDVRQLPRFSERVYRVLERHYVPGQGLSITIEDAADRVVEAERRRVERSPFRPQPPPRPQGQSGQSSARRPPLRRESQNNGAPRGQETDDDIINDLVGQIARSRSA